MAANRSTKVGLLQLLVLLLCCMSSRAGDCLFFFTDSQNVPQPNRTILIYYLGAPSQFNVTNIVVRDRVVMFSDDNGFLGYTNYVPGIYREEHQGTFGGTTNWLNLPVTNGTVWASDPAWSVAPTNVTSGMAAGYSQVAADGRFYPLASNPSNYLTAAAQQTNWSGGAVTSAVAQASHATNSDAATTATTAAFANGPVPVSNPAQSLVGVDAAQHFTYSSITPGLSGSQPTNANLTAVAGSNYVGTAFGTFSGTLSATTNAGGHSPLFDTSPGNGSGLTNVNDAIVITNVAGIVADGVTDVTIAMQTLMDKGGHLIAPPGVYLAQELRFTNNTHYEGRGAVWKYATGAANTNIFIRCGMNTNIVIEGLELAGGWSTNNATAQFKTYNGTQYLPTDPNQMVYWNWLGLRHGIQINCAGPNVYRDLVVHGFGGIGILPINTNDANAHFAPRATIHGITCYSNFAGVYADAHLNTTFTGGGSGPFYILPYITNYVDVPNAGASCNPEYTKWENATIFRNVIGASISAGNQLWVNATFSDNYIQAGGWGGSNPFHGIISGCNFNHTDSGSYIFWLYGTGNTGELINGCQFRGDSGGAAIIHIDTCQGTVIQNCAMEPITLTYNANSGTNFFINNKYFGTWSGFTVNNDGSAIISGNASWSAAGDSDGSALSQLMLNSVQVNIQTNLNARGSLASTNGLVSYGTVLLGGNLANSGALYIPVSGSPVSVQLGVGMNVDVTISDGTQGSFSDRNARFGIYGNYFNKGGLSIGSAAQQVTDGAFEVIGTSWHGGLASFTNGVTAVGGSFTGNGSGLTNIAGTSVQTNWISGQLYTNTSGGDWYVRALATWTTAGVTGDAEMDLKVGAQGAALSRLSGAGTSTTVAVTLSQSYSNELGGFINSGQMFAFTNSSSGAGNVSSLVTGTGQRKQF